MRNRERKNKKLYEFEINQFEEKAKLASTEIEKLRKENEQLKKFREEERLKRKQEVEQRSKVGCVTSPQGAMLVVQDLINTTRRMKEQLGPTLIRETQIRMEKREVTGTTKEIEVSPETRETCTARHVETMEIIETREIEK